uniref:FA complementation group D2 n=1 Tax=Scophthalmus maximus TaxID=52904 RepID=A0A8D3CL66_SCOMX
SLSLPLSLSLCLSPSLPPEAKKSRGSTRQPKEAVREDTNESVFSVFLRQAGVTLRQGCTSNEIAVDQVVFQKRIQQQLRKSPKYPGVVQEFITGLESHIEDPESFRNCLLPCAQGYFSYSQYLLRMLLGIEMLQVRLFFFTGDGGISVPHLIINQLKWLDRVVDSKELATKLMELVSVAPVDVQQDIITSLPEILEDSQHNDIARELNSLLQTNTQLTVPILDALSSLNLTVMSTLAAVQLEDLPVVVKFILHSVSAFDAYEVRTLNGVHTFGGKKEFDLLVLFILHCTNPNQSRRGAERILKSKVRTGLIQEALLQKTFRDYSQVGYFASILALAQCLLRSPDPCVVPFGGHMYRLSFTVFDPYCQQEVVGSLVTHVCSGVGGEVDMALELLCGLVTENPSEMALYAVFVKGILDYMDNLTPQQIRRLFHLLSRLAFGQQQQGSHIQDDMHIVIRKQLSSTVPKYKRIGIIGAVMIVGSMGAFSCALACVSGLVQVTALLELVRSSSESSPEAGALYYDELANLILSSTLDPQVQSVLDDFQDGFVVDLGLETTCSIPFPARVMYNLEEEDTQDGIAINLLPLLAKDIQNKGEQRVSPLCLSPFFRLLRLCEEKQHQGDLEEIDALLGCPLILTDMEAVEKMESLSKAEREFLCHLLFHTINWFREVINAFCRQKETEMKMKVMTRLQNITYLQTLLERALAGTAGYVPPVANFDGESSDGATLSSTAPVNKAKKGNHKRKTPGKASSESSSQLEEMTEADETQQEKEKEKEKEKEIWHGVSLVSYRQFFRELDMEVLSVLQCGLLSRSLLDSELHTKEKEEVLLGPAELVFLLEDMLRKLEFSLTSAPVRTDKSVGFSHLQQRSSKDIAACCVQLLPALCSHLENCHNHFQTLLSENDGVVDGPATDVQEQHLMSTCYQLLLQVLNTTFSWSGFNLPGQRSLLKKALGVLAERLNGHSELTLEQLVKHSFEYLLNFGSTMPSLSTALCLSQLLSTVSEKGGNPSTYREQTASLAKRFLSQDWLTARGEKERGNKFNEALHTLLSIYLENVDDVLKAVEEIAGERIPELLNAAKDESSASWPTLSRQTFLVFYKVMMAELEKAVRKIPASKISDNVEVSHKVLHYMTLFRNTILLTLIHHNEDVQNLLKTIQLSTRQLHHMCGHSKINQDTSLTNHVPALKKSLELFVYRVKATLTLNNCQEAFWIGNLKNRNLRGEEILSQRTEGSDDDEDDEEQEERHPVLPQEESEDEVPDISRLSQWHFVKFDAKYFFLNHIWEYVFGIDLDIVMENK